MKIIIIVILVLAGLFLLDRLMLRLEAKGYIYWRKVRPKGGTQSSTVVMLDQIFNPASRSFYEEKEKQKTVSQDKKKQGSLPGRSDRP